MNEFKCPECEKVSTSEKWNESTAEELDLGIDGIEEIESCGRIESWYICPECGEVVGGDNVEEIKNDKKGL